MVYGEGEEINKETGLIQCYQTLPASVVLEDFRYNWFFASRPWCFVAQWGCCLGSLISRGAPASISSIDFGLLKPSPIESLTCLICTSVRACTLTQSSPSSALSFPLIHLHHPKANPVPGNLKLFNQRQGI